MSNVPALLMNKVEQRHAWMTTHQIGDNPSRVEPDAASYSGRITYMKVIFMTLCC
jgi:hydroxypyruvate isomerase